MAAPALTDRLVDYLSEKASDEPMAISKDDIAAVVEEFVPSYYKIECNSSDLSYVAILDPKETKSMGEGIYIVIFFDPGDEDHDPQMSLVLSQGLSDFRDNYNRLEEKLQQRAEEVAAEIDTDDFQTGTLPLPSATGIQVYYPTAAIVHKQYGLDELKDQSVEADLEQLLGTYQEYVGREDFTEVAMETTILHIGQVSISRWNFDQSREVIYSQVFEHAIAKAIETDADAVVQTGGLFGEQTPTKKYVERLEKALTTLQQEGISFYHVPNHREIDMPEIQQFYKEELLKTLDDEATKIGSVALFGKQADETYKEVATAIMSPESTTIDVLVGDQAIDPPVDTGSSAPLSDLTDVDNSPLDLALVGNAPETVRYEDQMDVIAAGPTEPRLTERLLFQDTIKPYPRTVTEISINGVQNDVDGNQTDGKVQDKPYTQTTHKLPHKTLLVCRVRANTDIHTNRIYNRITDEGVTGATVAIKLFSETNYDPRPERLEKHFNEEMSVVKVWHEQSESIPAEGFDIDVDHYDSETEPKSRPLDEAILHVYQTATSETENYTQGAVTHQIVGDSNDERDVAKDEAIVILDQGRHKKEENILYGPFTAASTVEMNHVPEAWDGAYKYQVEVEWDQLYRVDLATTDIPLQDQDQLTGEVATICLEQLEERGTPITVTEDGQIEKASPSEGEAGPEEPDPPTETSGRDTPDIDTSKGITDLITLREHNNPIKIGTAIAEASQPGVALLQQAVDGELRPDLYRQALCHLVAGKNIIFYGPPGSGKTRLAERLSYSVCAEAPVATANAEWTYQQVVGGYQPVGEAFVPQPGILTEAAARCEQTLESYQSPSWLIIDELNRANLDEAFGEVFTLLDIDHRTDSQITYGGSGEETQTQRMPLAFRILGTMNTHDQAQLFALGYAFRRRFAFLKVPPLQSPAASKQQERIATDSPTLSEPSERARQIIREAVISYFTETSPTGDSPFAIPQLENDVFTGLDPVEDTFGTLRPPGEKIAPDEALLAFVESLQQNDVAELGQGIIIDALKYLVTANTLFPEETTWATVDEAVTSYILPQIEPFMSELRRAETMMTDSVGLPGNETAAEPVENNPIAAFREVQKTAEKLGLADTAARLKKAEETHEIIR